MQNVTVGRHIQGQNAPNYVLLLFVFDVIAALG
jgi:hypothetical protein